MAAGDLTDLATAYVACNIATSSPATDTILGTLITAISAYVPNVLNRNVVADNYIETYRGNGKTRLLLRQRPIIALTAISWRGQAAALATVDPITGGSGMWTDGRNACLTCDLCFPEGAPVRVAYSAGYNDIPADVSYAVAELVAEAYQRRTHVGETSRSANGNVTMAFDSRTMHAAIADKLSNYMAAAPC